MQQSFTDLQREPQRLEGVWRHQPTLAGMIRAIIHNKHRKPVAVAIGIILCFRL